jgi:hypothetical protein
MNCLSVCQKQIATNPRCSVSGKLPQAGSSGGESKIKYATQKNEKDVTMVVDPALHSEPMDNDPAGLTGGRESLAQSNCNLDESSVFDFEPNAKINSSSKNRTMKPVSITSITNLSKQKHAQIRNVTHVNQSLNDQEIRIELDRGKPAAKPGRFIDERKKNPAFLFEV